MWQTRTEILEKGRIVKIAIDQQIAPLRYSETLLLWKENADFRSFFIEILSSVPFSAFRWETPPITSATVERPFEFVVLDSPGLATTPDPISFASQFASEEKGSVVVFPNLGNDATLVVPRPLAAHDSYGHIAAFVRKAPETQKHELWQIVGTTVAAKLGRQPLWLSTAGAGVSWLHVRLDARPKYYGYAPYRTASK